MTTLLVVIALAAGGGVAWWLLRSSESVPVDPEEVQVVVPESADAGQRIPMPTTGTLIIRVRTPDATPLPHDTRAGYLTGSDRRMRPAAGDGTFRFSDAPLGRIEVVATADGYREGTGVAMVQPLVPAEVLVTLEPKP